MHAMRLEIPNDFCLNVVVPSQNLIRARAGPKYNLPFNPLLTTHLRSPNELPPSRMQLSKNLVLPHSKRRSTISSAGITNSNLWSAEI
jgi:hypothetical protein